MASETIVFVIDISSAINNELGDTPKLRHVVGAIARFIPIKRLLSPEHQFGIACLTTSLVWLVEPTKDTEIVLDMLSQLDAQLEETFCDFGHLLEQLYTTVQGWVLPSEHKLNLRLIMVYARPDDLWCDEDKAKQTLKELNTMVHLTVDLLDVAPESASQESMNLLRRLDPESMHGYAARCNGWEVSHGMAALLAMPPLRPKMTHVNHDYNKTRAASEL